MLQESQCHTLRSILQQDTQTCRIRPRTHTRMQTSTNQSDKTKATCMHGQKEKNIPHMCKYTQIHTLSGGRVSHKELWGNRLHWDWGLSPLHTKQAGTDGNLRAKHTPRACLHVCVLVCMHVCVSVCVCCWSEVEQHVVEKKERKRSSACPTANSHSLLHVCPSLSTFFYPSLPTALQHFLSVKSVALEFSNQTDRNVWTCLDVASTQINIHPTKKEWKLKVSPYCVWEITSNYIRNK